MNDLVQFLRARLDEDEHIARAAGSRQKGGNSWSVEQAEVRANDGTLIVRHTWPDEGTHIARHDPARVRKEVEGKRRVLAYAEQRAAIKQGEDDDDWENIQEATLETVLRFLALPYANHEAYRDDWRP